MNLKFFILGIYVLVTIVQVKGETEKPESNNEPTTTTQASKFQFPNIFNSVAALSKKMPTDRRFNPLQAIEDLSKKPIEMAMNEAMDKLFKSYSDPTKPFGPTYDTTWGSAPQTPPAQGRRMNSDEVRMSTMIQPPLGYGSPPAGTYSYSTQIQPRNFGHGLEPTLPSQVSQQTTYYGQQHPGYFPHPATNYAQYSHYYNQAQQQSQIPANRRAMNNEVMMEKIQKIAKESPKELETLIEQLIKGQSQGQTKNNDISLRNGFLGDVFDSDEASSVQVEFKAPKFPETTGKKDKSNLRRFFSEPGKGGDEMAKLLTASIKGLSVVGGYIFSNIDGGSKDQVYDMVMKFYEALREAKEQLNKS